MVNLVSTIVGKVSDAQPIAAPIAASRGHLALLERSRTATTSAAPTIHPVRIFCMHRFKNRDQGIAPIKSHGTNGSRSGDLPQGAFARHLITESANFIGCDPMV